MLKFVFWKKREMMLSAYKIYPEYKLIIMNASGTVSLKTLIAQKIDLNSDPLWNKEYTLIVDAFDCKVDALLSEIDDFIRFYHSNPKYMVGKRKVAYIINNESQFAYTKFLKEKQKDILSQEVRIFSNIDNALEFLELNHLHDKIAATLQQLQNEFKVYV